MSPKARQHYAERAQQQAWFDKLCRGPRDEEITLYETSECSIEGNQGGSRADRRHVWQLQVPGEWTRDGA
ncbi:hypothetical protein PILCRDRAFT_821141 [Piloderma croceum F 1598]|uniref:Uncharacterized protein n=1 Tax=Piloderma croceum (strain F 1598) TaxID=765440 RepID=A0A0C3BWQ5_PILCF|nr:hypothetical protein PILCRDRAFT_821141 [Piloderma croceum F 1598]